MDVYVTMDVTSGQMLCSDHCHWEKLLNDDMRFALADANYNSGITTLMIGIWVNSAILMSRKLRNEKRYQNLLTYTLTATLRRAVPSLATTLPFKCLYDCLKFSKYTCKFFGFVDTFLAVFEIESLAQVCIERLIYAMYKNKGWDIPRWHNKLFIGISLLLAALYSSLPLLGYGSYGKDFDCANCTFDMLLPATDAYKLIVILILVLKSLKPAIVMGLSLNYARWMEMTKIRQDNEDNIKFTMSICIIVMLNMVFWFPIFLVRSSLIMSQILYKSTELTWSPCFVMWAISMHWISPTVAMIGLAWYNTRLRTKMKNLLKFRSVDSDEPQPEAQDDKTQESTAQEVKTQEPKAQEVKAHDPKVKAQPAN